MEVLATTHQKQHKQKDILGTSITTGDQNFLAILFYSKSTTFYYVAPYIHLLCNFYYCNHYYYTTEEGSNLPPSIPLRWTDANQHYELQSTRILRHYT